VETLQLLIVQPKVSSGTLSSRPKLQSTNLKEGQRPSFFMMNQELKKIEALMNAKRYEEAERLTNKTTMSPSTKYAVLASIALKQENYQRADVLFGKSLALDPGHIVANANYAQMLLSTKKTKQAYEYAKAAYTKDRKNLQYALLYIACLADRDLFKEAIEVLEPFTKQPNPSLKVLLNYATMLRADLRPVDAIEVLEKASLLYPEDPESVKAIADAYSEIDPKIASEAFGKAFEKMPDSIPLKWNSSFVELRLRNFARGWELYEAGLHEKIGKIGRPLPAQVRSFPQITQIEKLDQNKWTFFTAEQGLGDQILFYSCLNELLRDVPKAVLIAEDRMVGILKRSFPNVPVYTYGFAAAMSHQAHRINGVFPIGSLMKYYRNTEQAFLSNLRPYLIPDKKKVENLKEILTKQIGNKKLVGISWRGGFWDRQKRTKSFEFELLSKAFTEKDIQFISLQYGDVKEEKEFARKAGLNVTFIDGIDFKKDIETWFALACACDEVLSVSTALVHFVGAAGRKVNLLIGDYQAPFIWGMEPGPSIAYPNVYIHRKAKEETDEAFFNRISEVVR
jgi:tetratricopeptide (TPR) repeat protein